ncbi:RNA polymerase, sigma-24 subunit, ECF subfamily OS=Tsukamurella paurometabola (strain ATCC 8368 /DSM / CCUG 35730 / CIP 100753 / JCM 10117 / KCTC 9821/ NBRC 16120 / NCIMB 702349 / NCTC 13040) OX=521096 GN=Tpau_0399 PE=3 SV=1 [Tsukamurella paurometabola]|uniref:RNA polymerase, sigma-24 subunit, ECF subfamily n=1 Tax=Tsukamurella paurometabola (strain ATCC 8368 / DSM 20162 / CCUG 35730 / CIP 100753 / JCM 10117 / KCTC 9821 / NBRC 16120 / NCIMB 702349 / NCTC 13040) TaxID=521096 RepID=D5URI7_TSUPD|nr:RNA polymerase sigma-70 factor [Tsukamurella paurometabola]ADG77040.1 RNA polymerase, sigma-24 subunit, ECF subfamily [Tsukamurella paurometabola DSM 20162]SUP42564.1 RNA polymerase sigma-E factor [Tsukamurella paurometabola]
MTTAAEVFTEYRPLLFSIGYEILGSVADTEDVLQESYLRWSDVDLAVVENPRAYLARIVTRQALNALRGAARRREQYVGPWLPEPLETPSGDAPTEHVLTGEAVTTAMLLVLESLTPTERAVFVLREVFGFGYPEIAEAVGKSEATVRQTAHRARGHVQARRPRTVVDPAVAQGAAERFLTAAATGDVQALMDVLAPDAVYLGDGGGVVSAARRPVHGADKVARMLIGLFRKGAAMGEMGLRFAVYNGMPAMVVSFDGVVDQVTCIEVDGAIVTGVYCVRNPAKLRSVSMG